MLKNLQTIISPRFKGNLLIAFLMLFALTAVKAQRGRKPRPAGVPSEIQVTPYKTTMIANGKDQVLISLKIIDSHGDSLANADIKATLHLLGDASIINIMDAGDFNTIQHTDTTWQVNIHGSCRVILQAGRTFGKIKLSATADSLYAGATEIHTVQPGVAHVVTHEKYKPQRTTDKIIGADISFLPQLEARGMKFTDNGVAGDPMEMMKAHGFNYIRLRIFVNPENPKGYSPKQGFCDLAHTEAMAKRIKAAGMKFLLDFHYSDYWADPQQQNKPAAWVGEDFSALKKSLHDYTVAVMQALKNQGTVPDMVQVGNEINHGMVWPEGSVANLDSLAQLIYEGVEGVKAVSPKTIVMLHIALGGQNAEARFFLDNMKARNVPFDVIGLSYYPKWHGTLADLKNNMADLAKRYPQQVMVAEYSQLKNEVNDIAFNVPGDKAVGSFIWEPIGSWEGIFDADYKNKEFKANDFLNAVYPEIAKKYVK
ncbi:MAG TPA: glycosyl hydrolase 53 family protein [Mucilaginibacter sp.]|jgi:beta-galactosidase|nr:glycosyl hydrolase 53 family protein [Mucilaginibacter sp.]